MKRSLSEATARKAFEEAAPKLREQGHHVHSVGFRRPDADEIHGLVVVATAEAARRIHEFIDKELPAAKDLP